MKTTLVTLLVTFVFGCSLACRPILRIYESEGTGEDFVEVAREWIGVNNEPNLTAKGIQNRNIRTCPEGVWMGYENANYTGKVVILYTNPEGLNTCNYNDRDHKYRSVKIVGSTASYTQSAVTTYALDSSLRAIGDDNVYLNDTQNLVSSFTALAITGNEEVELFTGLGFGGLSVCVRPKNGYISTYAGFLVVYNNRNGAYLHTFLTNLKDIFGNVEFQSFSFGCRNNTNSLLNALLD